MMLHDRIIYLASKSPRRRELLLQIGVSCELLLGAQEVDESVHPAESPTDYVARVTRDKAINAQHLMEQRKLLPRPILAADTTVVLDGQILGKPASEAQAIAMLASLSGRTHQVLTSVVVCHHNNRWQITHSSEVRFATLSSKRIRAYCATQEPYDKAGGYGIQGIASVFIRDIIGSHSGIMGLPLFETAQLLQQAGLDIL
ncbi:Maf family protein [Herbaspirillum sp. RTI4]|uniref:Maf family protein n=1 Tax=Herbaspirillum sp. RTI4 TaxID=3048640 RepID=UPI002AB3E299|nr:Maf family protein [Herbaspirillum sp. RTI4]MDY7580011.1 Maf family protein [Herbaspirillum sp. RTI4]MEA9982825.1 Maf family protein [Herbaspirillum sp. RTI4]